MSTLVAQAKWKIYRLTRLLERELSHRVAYTKIICIRLPGRQETAYTLLPSSSYQQLSGI